MNVRPSVPPIETPSISDGPLLRPRRPASPWRWRRPHKPATQGEPQTHATQAEPIFAVARPRRMKRCARGVFLWSLGFYVVAVMVLNAIMERWCPAAFEQVYRMKWDRLCQMQEETPDRPLVVMLGSSRTDDAFQAGRLEEVPGPDGRPIAAYNFGVPAAGPIHEYLYLRQMLDRGIRPRLLLVEFLPPLFNDAHSRLISEENWTYPEWVTASQLAQMAHYYVRPVRKGKIWLESRVAPWCVYRAFLRNWLYSLWDPSIQLSPPIQTHDSWGFRYPEDLTPEVRAARSAGACDYILTLRHFRLGKGPARAMRDVLELCRQEQIPVVLVITPESTTFRSWYSAQCLASTDKLLADLRAAYGVEVIDARQWVRDQDFIDGHHVAAPGADRFSIELRNRVAPLLR
jgi:hypothetical protein